MTDAEVAKLYRRYEARFGNIMTKIVCKTALRAAAIAASYFLPVRKENHSTLIEDLEADQTRLKFVLV